MLPSPPPSPSLPPSHTSPPSLPPSLSYISSFSSLTSSHTSPYPPSLPLIHLLILPPSLPLIHLLLPPPPSVGSTERVYGAQGDVGGCCVHESRQRASRGTAVAVPRSRPGRSHRQDYLPGPIGEPASHPVIPTLMCHTGVESGPGRTLVPGLLHSRTTRDLPQAIKVVGSKIKVCLKF